MDIIRNGSTDLSTYWKDRMAQHFQNGMVTRFLNHRFQATIYHIATTIRMATCISVTAIMGMAFKEAPMALDRH